MGALVIAAHPDDEVLGCGGIIAKSKDINVLILSHNPRLNEKDIKKAHVLLGIKQALTHTYPDNEFDTVPLLNIVKTIEKVIFNIQPEIVYTHFGGDLNIDHRRVFEATMAAVRPMKENYVKKVYCYEVPSATEWAFGKLGEFVPNTFVDISEVLEKKLVAMEAYKTEIRDFPHPRSKEALIALAKWRGVTVGFKAAEAFELVVSR